MRERFDGISTHEWMIYLFCGTVLWSPGARVIRGLQGVGWFFHSTLLCDTYQDENTWPTELQATAATGQVCAPYSIKLKYQSEGHSHPQFSRRPLQLEVVHRLMQASKQTLPTRARPRPFAFVQNYSLSHHTSRTPGSQHIGIRFKITRRAPAHQPAIDSIFPSMFVRLIGATFAPGPLSPWRNSASIGWHAVPVSRFNDGISRS